MRLYILVAIFALVELSRGQESNWKWGGKETEITIEDDRNLAVDDLSTAPSEQVESFSANTTELEGVIDELLVSTREGRNLDGYDEVYSDPNVQEALQKGNDGEARNLIKERLCTLGLMKVFG